MKTQNKITMRNLKYIFILPLAGLFVACGSHENNQFVEADPVSVQVAEAVASSGSSDITVSGKIEAANSANISTRMMGNITQVKVKPGQKVQAGDLLVTISSTDLSAKRAQVEASINQAQAAYDDAKRDYDRFRDLYEKGSASQKEFEGMQTRLQMTEAGLEAAKQMKAEVDAQFAYANIRAPFSGVVANTFVKEGDIAHPGMPIVAVEGTSNYQATVLVPESKIGLVKVGAKASVLIKSDNKRVEGTVIEVSPSAKNTGGQFIVKIDLNTTTKLLPGMFVNADIESDVKSTIESSPLVSLEAIVRNGQLNGIYTLGTNNTAILRWIRMGNETDGQVEVLSGLSAGEKYILKAEGKLYNGVKILQK